MRLEIIADAEQTPRQRELSARITARRGAVRGPYRVWLRSPELCERVEALGAFARFESSLPERVRLLALLIACREFDAQYSWNAHVDQALAAGIPNHVIEAIAHRETPAYDDADERAFHDLAIELLREHFVADETFDRALAAFGAEGVVDAVGTIGNYVMLSLCLNAFEVDLQPDRTPPFPDVCGYARVEAAAAE